MRPCDCKRPQFETVVFLAFVIGRRSDLENFGDYPAIAYKGNALRSHRRFIDRCTGRSGSQGFVLFGTFLKFMANCG
jgi:hypothetical protein